MATQQQSQRNWALTEADKLIKAHASSDGAEVKLEWKDRAVKVNGQIAFQQNKNDVGGTFNAPFGSIELPCGPWAAHMPQNSTPISACEAARLCGSVRPGRCRQRGPRSTKAEIRRHKRVKEKTE